VLQVPQVGPSRLKRPEAKGSMGKTTLELSINGRGMAVL
jgi:hypothetical protein